MSNVIPLRVESPVVAADLNPVRERAGDLLAAASRLPLALTDETNASAGDVVAGLTRAAKDWEALRVQAKGPFLQAAKQVDTAFAGLADEIAKAKKAVGAKQTAFLIAKEAEMRRQAEERAKAEETRRLAEAERLEAAGKKEAAEEMLEAAVETPEVPTRIGVVARGVASTTSLRSVWSFKVVDFAALPDQYKLVDEKALGALARGERPDIPGVRWVEDKVSVTRR